MMRGSDAKGLTLVVRQFLIFLIGALLILISELPVHAPGYSQIAANIGLATVFYLSVYRPELLPAISALILGLWQDVLAGTLIGGNALVFLIVREVIVVQFVFFRSRTFPVIWCCFALTVLAAVLLDWMAATLLAFSVISPYPGLFHAVATVGVFPFVAWLCSRIEQPVMALNVPR